MFERLVQAIAPQGKIIQTWPLKGGISAEMIAIEIAFPTGETRKWIVRRPYANTLARNPSAPQAEFNFLLAAHSLGLPTPFPIFLDSSGEFLSSPGLVIEFIEGQPIFAPMDLDGFARQAAAQLARIHHIHGSCLDVALLPRPRQDFTGIIGQNLSQPHQALDVSPILTTLDSVFPPTQRNPPVLLHGDYWPGNLLWQNDQLVAVVDWEDASFGDPLIDLAISRLDILWIFDRNVMDSFTRGYQSRMAINFSDLPYYDLCAALRLARLVGSDLDEWATFFLPYGRQDITAQSIRQHYQRFIAQAINELVNRHESI